MEQTPLSPAPATFLSAKLILPLFGILAVVAGIVSLVVLNQGSLDLRQRASTSTGTVTVTLKPGTSTLTPSSAQTLELQTNTGAANVTGYELFIDFTGTVPSDLTYTPTDPTGLSTATSSVDPTSNGKRLTVGLLAPIGNPPKSFTTSNATVTLGKITFTAPATGSMTVAFVPQLSRSLLFNSDINNTTETDVLKTPATYIYSFGQTATVRPTSTPVGVDPTLTPTPISGIVCYGSVITSGNTLQWPDGCRGRYVSGQSCTMALVPLSSSEIAGYNAWVAAGRPPTSGCPSPKPTVTPSPSAQATDDLYFATATEANSIFWFYEAGTRTFVASNHLVIGRTYSVEISPQIQNKVKTTAIDNRNLVIGLRVNGNIIDTANNFYSLVSNHADGAGFQLSGNFVAQAQNKFEVVIDPSNTLKETNETNNIFTRSYAGVTSTPTPTPITGVTCATTTVTNTFSGTCMTSDTMESTFQWKPVTGATEYAFTFLNANDGVMLSLGYTSAANFSCTSTACKKTIALRSDYAKVIVHARGTCRESSSQATIKRIPSCVNPTPSLRTCASQGGICRSKSGVCGDGAYNYAASSDCSSTQNCCVPIITPQPVPTSGTASCNVNNIAVTPTSGNWNRTPSFRVMNSTGTAMTINWSLDNWSSNASDQNGTSTIAAGQYITLGLGDICSQWSLNINCPNSSTGKGFSVESYAPACSGTTVPTVSPATPAPTTRPAGGISAEQWNRLPAWVRQLIQRFLQ